MRRLPALLGAVWVPSSAYPAVRYLLILIVATVSVAATPRRVVYFLPVEPLISKLSTANDEWADIAVFFRGQEHPPVTKTIGEGRSHRKADATFRSDPRACRMAFLAAVRSLQKGAWDEGGNALVNVRSHNTASGGTPKYRCVAGTTNASVRLEGDVVRVDDAELTELRDAEELAGPPTAGAR